jgi:hypothetical protein
MKKEGTDLPAHLKQPRVHKLYDKNTTFQDSKHQATEENDS